METEIYAFNFAQDAAFYSSGFVWRRIIGSVQI